ncbi:MAG: hypothetical protein RID91_01220 [Azospirillaceae bacterium]
MTAAKPETERDTLFNRFFGEAADDGAFWEDREAIRQAAWRVRGLVRRAPGDFATRVLETGLLVKSGDRSGAEAAARSAITLRDARVVPAQAALIRCCLVLGLFEEAVALSRELTDDPTLRAADPTMNVAPHAALVAGDIGYLRELAALAAPYRGIDVAALLLRTLTEAGIADPLPGHQSIVNAVLGSASTWLTVEVLWEEDDPPVILIVYFIDQRREQCERLHDAVTDRLFEYYRSRGMPGAPYLGYLIMDTSSPRIDELDETAA